MNLDCLDTRASIAQCSLNLLSQPQLWKLHILDLPDETLLAILHAVDNDYYNPPPRDKEGYFYALLPVCTKYYA